MKKLLYTATTILGLAFLGNAAQADPGRGANILCYVWANNASPALNVAYTPSTTYSYNADGRAPANSVRRTAVGTYQVACRGIGGGAAWGSGGHVQVTAYGSSASYCKVGSWGSAGADVTVNVRCYIGTSLRDSQFDMLFAW